MAKMKIKKRRRSPGEHVDALAQIPKGISLWWRRMCGSWVYREWFWSALWGEMGEYEIRFSTFAGGILPIVGGIVGLWYLPSAVFLVKIKFCIFAALILIGIYMLGDLNGPIWWADRLSLKAYEDYRQTNRFRKYRRYSDYVRSQVRSQTTTAMPLKVEEVTYLCELYHQLCTNTLSVESVRQLGTYTVGEINFFYQFFGIQPSDPHFNPAWLQP